VRTDLLEYDLPWEMIALRPPERRDGGRLMVLGPSPGETRHARVADLSGLIPAGALLVANDSRVIPARLRGRRPTGGAVEILLVRRNGGGEGHTLWTALARAARPLRIGDRLDLSGAPAEVADIGERGEIELRIIAEDEEFGRHVERVGEVPLPPYIRRPPEPADRERYQTVFARRDGSVAAPTAGLHLTEEMLGDLAGRGVEVAFVTLHVGPGTFRPIEAPDTSDHRMDGEEYEIGEGAAAAIGRARAEGRPVVAVGTTVVRALEDRASARGRVEPGAGVARLFIAPGHRFRAVDALLTNFHLPRSTLLCLVAALAGTDRILAAYREAIAEGYRFYSYGDAMLLLPEAP